MPKKYPVPEGMMLVRKEEYKRLLRELDQYGKFSEKVEDIFEELGIPKIDTPKSKRYSKHNADQAGR